MRTKILLDKGSNPSNRMKMSNKIWYFAYGSNLNKDQMCERVGGYYEAKKALLKDYEIVFSGFSPRWGGGIATIRKRGGEVVHGVLYLLDEKAIRILDKYEGVPKKYERILVKVITEKNELLDAYTYILKNHSRLNKPSQRYIQTIIEGLIQHGYENKIIEKVKEIANKCS
jgi:cation transport regulator ChaC